MGADSIRKLLKDIDIEKLAQELRTEMRQATSDMSVKSAGASQAIEGRELARALERMVDFKRYCERATRRLGGDSQMLSILLESLSGRKGILRKEELTLRKVFQDGDLMAKVEGALHKAGYKTELTPDEEHGLWEIETVTSTGVNMIVDWNFATSSAILDLFPIRLASMPSSLSMDQVSSGSGGVSASSSAFAGGFAGEAGTAAG